MASLKGLEGFRPSAGISVPRSWARELWVSATLVVGRASRNGGRGGLRVDPDGAGDRARWKSGTSGRRELGSRRQIMPVDGRVGGLCGGLHAQARFKNQLLQSL